MNKFNRFLRYILDYAPLYFPLVLCFYLLSWIIVVIGGYLPQEVCDTAAFPASMPALRDTSSSAPDFLSAPKQLPEWRENFDFQYQYALRSTRAEFHELAPVIEESNVRLEALVPSFLHWSQELSYFADEFVTNHIVFTTHLNACLACPKQRPRPFAIRVFHPLPEASSILRGYFGPSLIPSYTRPTTLQVYRHVTTQYQLFRKSSTENLKTIRSYIDSTHFNASSRAVASALHDVRAHTTRNRNTFQRLCQDITANPPQATRVLDSLGWKWSDARLSRQSETLGAFDHALSEANAYIQKVSPFILRTERDLLDLDVRFDRVTAEDMFRGRDTAAMLSFRDQLATVLGFPEKIGISEIGLKKLKRSAERRLGIWREGDEGANGAEAQEARNEREL